MEQEQLKRMWQFKVCGALLSWHVKVQLLQTCKAPESYLGHQGLTARV